jgi:7-cyano-7-deazaguanine reductase
MNTNISRSPQDLKHLALGENHTLYPQNYAPHVLEVFPNKHPQSQQWVSFIASEFTSLCPKTQQPDFARIFINYIAKDFMVESKSLKLYLFSFRNHGDFHEDCVQTICQDLFDLMKPAYIEVCGEFTPRGGISIFPFSQKCDTSDLFMQELSKQRLFHYSPGRYSVSLSRLYGQ